MKGSHCLVWWVEDNSKSILHINSVKKSDRNVGTITDLLWKENPKDKGRRLKAKIIHISDNLEELHNMTIDKNGAIIPREQRAFLPETQNAKSVVQQGGKDEEAAALELAKTMSKESRQRGSIFNNPEPKPSTSRTDMNNDKERKEVPKMVNKTCQTHLFSNFTFEHVQQLRDAADVLEAVINSTQDEGDRNMPPGDEYDDLPREDDMGPILKAFGRRQRELRTPRKNKVELAPGTGMYIKQSSMTHVKLTAAGEYKRAKQAWKMQEDAASTSEDQAGKKKRKMKVEPNDAKICIRKLIEAMYGNFLLSHMNAEGSHGKIALPSGSNAALLEYVSLNCKDSITQGEITEAINKKCGTARQTMKQPKLEAEDNKDQDQIDLEGENDAQLEPQQP